MKIDDLRILVAGCGSIGHRHLGHLKRLGIQYLAACDRIADRRDLVQADYCIETFDDFEKSLSAFNPNIVFVCTPAHLHVPMAQSAITFGADVFIEKPLSLSSEGVNTLISSAQTKKRIVQVGYNMRFHPGIRQVKKVIDAGTIGRIVSAQFNFGLYLPTWWKDRDYRQTYIVKKEVGGGLLFDVSHEIDTARWLIGEVRCVNAFGAIHPEIEMDSPNVLHLNMQFQNDAIAHIEMDCWRPAYTRICNLVGTHGEVMWDCPDGRIDTSSGHLKIRTHTATHWQSISIEGESDSVYRDELLSFLDCVINRGKPLVDLSDAAETLDVLLALNNSLENRCVQSLVSRA